MAAATVVFPTPPLPIVITTPLPCPSIAATRSRRLSSFGGLHGWLCGPPTGVAARPPRSSLSPPTPRMLNPSIGTPKHGMLRINSPASDNADSLRLCIACATGSDAQSDSKVPFTTNI